ncbi:hypothetical protein T265_07136 [Opisthorchis viverrini]|uniref:Uncharacterized protein n=1 Tax=Opisthorchis viverrini TaxID=6198 RepID=A0A074ZDZ2_OPIVI|nr:hypothetical protein T265_07136 [Opisthorchis viverrini]KER25393.1 hypothetical protein T265_07136 [Opisthorchis viverrini]
MSANTRKTKVLTGPSAKSNLSSTWRVGLAYFAATKPDTTVARKDIDAVGEQIPPTAYQPPLRKSDKKQFRLDTGASWRIHIWRGIQLAAARLLGAPESSLCLRSSEEINFSINDFSACAAAVILIRFLSDLLRPRESKQQKTYDLGRSKLHVRHFGNATTLKKQPRHVVTWKRRKGGERKRRMEGQRERGGEREKQTGRRSPVAFSNSAGYRCPSPNGLIIRASVAQQAYCSDP